MDLMLKPRYPYSFTILESPSSPPSALQGCTYLYFTPGTWGTWVSLKIQETSPAAQTHAQPYLHITGGERGQDSSELLPPPVCRLPSNPVSTMVLLLGLPHEKRPPPPPAQSIPFLEGTSHSLLSWDGLSRLVLWGRRVRSLLPSGVTWALNGGSWAGLGWEGKGTGPAAQALKPINLYTTIKTSPW